MILKTVVRTAGLLNRALASLNCDGGHGLALAAGCAFLAGVQLTGGRALLAYDRAALAGGELWRLLTAHLVHLDLSHAALNSLGLILMWALFARDYSPRQWLAILAAAAAAIDAGLWFRSSTVEWYVGSSGVLHGVMAAGSLAHLRRGDLDRWLLPGFLLLKIAYEQLAGALPFAGHLEVVVDAHLYGALGGAAAALAMRPAPLP
jgi:rhomboid family GlyGly-CTERM serine protease